MFNVLILAIWQKNTKTNSFKTNYNLQTQTRIKTLYSIGSWSDRINNNISTIRQHKNNNN